MTTESLVGKRIWILVEHSQWDKWSENYAEIISDVPGPFSNSGAYVVEYWEQDTGYSDIFRLNREDFELL